MNVLTIYSELFNISTNLQIVSRVMISLYSFSIENLIPHSTNSICFLLAKVKFDDKTGFRSRSLIQRSWHILWLLTN